MSRSFLLILLVVALNVEGAEPRRVLLLHSFGHDFEPFATFSTDFRKELARGSTGRLDFFDVSLASARFESTDEVPVVDYLNALFRGRPVDLVVALGGSAARFAQKHRGQLFLETPMLLTCLDQRHIQRSILTDKDAVIAVRHDVGLMVEAILRLLPDTTNVAVVFGNSPLEKFWTDEFGREIGSLTNQVGWESFSHLSFEQMKKRAAALPPHSVMLYGQLLIDAEGIPLSNYESLANLNAVANSPIFGIHDIQLGHGIVGGPLVSVRELARQGALGAARILAGESPASVRPPPIIIGTPTYDWRELRRRKIPEDRLPPGSIIKFRVPTPWERYWFAIVTGGSALVVQTGLIVGLVLNQRRLRKAERSLRESEERMKLAAGAAALGLWEWDAAADRVWVAGPLAERIGPDANGKAPGHQDLLRTVHPDDRNVVEAAIRKSLNGEGDFDLVHRHVLSDGKIVWIAARARVDFGANGKPARMRGISMDITAQKLAEEQARESERQFLATVNSAPVLIWTTGSDKLCTFVNQRWLEFRGRTLEEELGNGWLDGVHPDDRAKSFKVYSESFDAREPFTMEFRVRRRDGQFRWVLDQGVPRYDSQRQFFGYIGSCVDVTERKEAEAEAQRLQQEVAHVSRVAMLGELAGSTAHELNQPLTAIVSSAEAAEHFMKVDHWNEQEVRDALKDIAEQGQRAGEIIAGIRGMLKKDPGQMTKQDINLAVREVLEMVHSDLLTRGVTPVLRLDPQLPCVNGDGVQLRQVLLNLVMNACDAISDVPAEQRRLTIESKRATANEIEVSVADSGPGFTEEMLRNAFEPFRTTKPKGLGLGLVICRSIIRAHGGRLVAANNGDKGATLRFTLPAGNENNA